MYCPEAWCKHQTDKQHFLLAYLKVCHVLWLTKFVPQVIITYMFLEFMIGGGLFVDTQLILTTID